MLKKLCNDYALRGYTFEFISKILLRRKEKNNFIFQTNQFDSIKEILTKYRLQSNSPVISKQIDFLKEEGLKCDIIAFYCEERTIKEIVLFEVKTKYHSVQRDYYEMCISNHQFMKKSKQAGIQTKIISIVLFENWKFSFNIYPYETSPIKTYSNYKINKKSYKQ